MKSCSLIVKEDYKYEKKVCTVRSSYIGSFKITDLIEILKEKYHGKNNVTIVPNADKIYNK